EGRGHETTSPSKPSKAHKAPPLSSVINALSLSKVNVGIVVLEHCDQRAGSVNETTSPKKHSEKFTALSLPPVMCTVPDPVLKYSSRMAKGLGVNTFPSKPKDLYTAPPLPPLTYIVTEFGVCWDCGAATL
ncbi:hypothetical protein P7K49_026262, partial [Saguinus oedipus]